MKKEIVMKEEVRVKARQNLLEMAKDWEKRPEKTQHAVEAYETVIGSDPESKEADLARKAILEIAKRLEGKGKKYAAYHIYEKMAEGREERGKPIC